MKPLFFSLLVLISFTATAQLPKAGQDGYKDIIPGRKGIPPLGLENGRNKFLVFHVDWEMAASDVKETTIDSFFAGHKSSYNQRYYYASYQYKNNYVYAIFIHPKMLYLNVTSMFNDAEFEKCKRMLDKQADIYISGKK